MHYPKNINNLKTSWMTINCTCKHFVPFATDMTDFPTLLHTSTSPETPTLLYTWKKGNLFARESPLPPLPLGRYRTRLASYLSVLPFEETPHKWSWRHQTCMILVLFSMHFFLLHHLSPYMNEESKCVDTGRLFHAIYTRENKTPLKQDAT